MRTVTTVYMTDEEGLPLTTATQSFEDEEAEYRRYAAVLGIEPSAPARSSSTGEQRRLAEGAVDEEDAMYEAYRPLLGLPR